MSTTRVLAPRSSRAGSQAEEGSALMRIAARDHQIQFRREDHVIFSSRPIPGNEGAVMRLQAQLRENGARPRAHAHAHSPLH